MGPAGNRRSNKKTQPVETRCVPGGRRKLPHSNASHRLSGGHRRQALLGRGFRVPNSPANYEKSFLAPFILATVHPSSILRPPTMKPAERNAALHRRSKQLVKLSTHDDMVTPGASAGMTLAAWQLRLVITSRNLTAEKVKYGYCPVKIWFPDLRSLRRPTRAAAPQERLAAAFRLFASSASMRRHRAHPARDPERPDHFWVNPFGVHFSQIRVPICW